MFFRTVSIPRHASSEMADSPSTLMDPGAFVSVVGMGDGLFVSPAAGMAAKQTGPGGVSRV